VRSRTVARFALAAGLAVLFAFPLYWMVVTAVSPLSELRSGDYGIIPHHIELANLQRAWERFPMERWILNSVVIAVVSVTLTVTINVVCGYAFAKLRFPGRDLLFLLIISTLMIPVQVIMVPQFQIVAGFGWLDTYWGVIIPRAAEAFGIFFARQYFRSIPDELIEAARIDGAGELAILRRVVLPLCKPLIAVLVIFTFMWRWNEFAWPLIILKDTELYTLPIGMLFLKGQYSTDVTALMSMGIVSVIPMVLVFAFFQRYFVEGMVRSGLK
jgi:multiple sugar transport system permease protein/alpha-1,4-digalacturonate transport system permease protein